jgi:predicted nucleic acid-binding protein
MLTKTEELKVVSSLCVMIVMTNRIFVDSNVWVYLFTKDDAGKRRMAHDFIFHNANDNDFVISHQVINEVCYVLKKRMFSEPELRKIAHDLAEICVVCNYSTEIIMKASQLRESYALSFWDSNIVACALASQSKTLASEDMQNGLRIDNLVIRNIFQKENH